METLFFLGTDAHWQQLSDCAKSDGFLLHRLQQGNFDALTAHMQQVTDPVWVLYSEPAEVVGSQLLQSSLDDALTRWQHEVSEFLAIQRRHRRQLKLLCTNALLSIKGIDNKPNLKALAGQTPATSVTALIAQTAIQSRSALQQLVSVLQASSVQTGATMPIMVEPWLQEYRELCDKSSRLQQLEQSHQQTEQENELLLQQLMQVQEELEKYYLQTKSSQADVKRLESQIQQLQIQLQQQADAQQKAEREATARQNHSAMLQKQAERELVKAQAQIKTLQRQLAGASLSGQQAQSELKIVQSSTLWKAMSPVRKLTSTRKKQQQKLQKEIGLLKSCPLFNESWYLKEYPDVASSGADPIEHYLRYGAKEGRAPGPDFDGNWYLSHYADVAGSGINPLVHYVKFGQLEGRQTSPKFLQLKRNKP